RRRPIRRTRRRARFLKLGWLPEVPVPSEQVRTRRRLLQAREPLVSLRTKLKNMAPAPFSRNGLARTRAVFASAVRRARLAKREQPARGGRRHQSIRHVEAVGLLRRTGDLAEAVERDD